MIPLSYKKKKQYPYRKFIFSVQSKQRNIRRKRIQKKKVLWKIINIPTNYSLSLVKQRSTLKQLVKKTLLEISQIKVGLHKPFINLPIRLKRRIIYKFLRCLKNLNKVTKKRFISLSNLVFKENKSLFISLNKTLIAFDFSFTQIKKKKLYRRNIARKAKRRRRVYVAIKKYVNSINRIKRSLKLRQLKLRQFAKIFVRPTRSNIHVNISAILSRYRHMKRFVKSQKIPLYKIKKDYKNVYISHVKYLSSAGLVRFYGRRKKTYYAREKIARRIADFAKVKKYLFADILFKRRYQKIYTPILKGLVIHGLIPRLIRMKRYRSHSYKRLCGRRRV